MEICNILYGRLVDALIQVTDVCITKDFIMLKKKYTSYMDNRYQ